jgi:hypothetical protein
LLFHHFLVHFFLLFSADRALFGAASTAAAARCFLMLFDAAGAMFSASAAAGMSTGQGNTTHAQESSNPQSCKHFLKVFKFHTDLPEISVKGFYGICLWSFSHVLLFSIRLSP